MAIKLNISKAYDKLEWSFLNEMMKKLGFHDLWISRIMARVTTVTYATLINDQPDSIIKPSRSIRQGNIIFSYLYLICVEGLSLLLNEIEQSNKISRVKVAKGNQTTNHLFFCRWGMIIFYRENLIE